MSKNRNAEPKVTSLQEMKTNAIQIVPIPSWDNEGEVFVRMRRVTLLALIQEGQLPNELLSVAHKVMNKPKGDPNAPIQGDDPQDVTNFTAMLHAVAKAALVDPTYDQIKEEVCNLTDQQLMAIFFYCMSGVKALENFRKTVKFTSTDGDSSQNL